MNGWKPGIHHWEPWAGLTACSVPTCSFRRTCSCFIRTINLLLHSSLFHGEGFPTYMPLLDILTSCSGFLKCFKIQMTILRKTFLRTRMWSRVLNHTQPKTSMSTNELLSHLTSLPPLSACERPALTVWFASPVCVRSLWLTAPRVGAETLWSPWGEERGEARVPQYPVSQRSERLRPGRRRHRRRRPAIPGTVR